MDEPGYYTQAGDRLVHVPPAETRSDAPRVTRSLLLAVFLLFPVALGVALRALPSRSGTPAVSLTGVARAVAASGCADVAVYIVSQPPPPGTSIEQVVAEQVHADASASVTRGRDTIVVVGWDCA